MCIIHAKIPLCVYVHLHVLGWCMYAHICVVHAHINTHRVGYVLQHINICVRAFYHVWSSRCCGWKIIGFKIIFSSTMCLQIERFLWIEQVWTTGWMGPRSLKPMIFIHHLLRMCRRGWNRQTSQHVGKSSNTCKFICATTPLYLSLSLTHTHTWMERWIDGYKYKRHAYASRHSYQYIPKLCNMGLWPRSHINISKPYHDSYHLSRLEGNMHVSLSTNHKFNKN